MYSRKIIRLALNIFAVNIINESQRILEWILLQRRSKIVFTFPCLFFEPKSISQEKMSLFFSYLRTWDCRIFNLHDEIWFLQGTNFQMSSGTRFHIRFSRFSKIRFSNFSGKYVRFSYECWFFHTINFSSLTPPMIANQDLSPNPDAS